jgi:uncharacterized membrane protein
MTLKSSAHIEHGTVAKNIEAILKLEEDDERRLPHLHRVSHKVGWFVGTTYFVIIQAAFVVLWVLWNASASQPFDPFPFPMLSAVLAFEAVFLTSFVLIRQNTMIASRNGGITLTCRLIFWPKRKRPALSGRSMR